MTKKIINITLGLAAGALVLGGIVLLAGRSSDSDSGSLANSNYFDLEPAFDFGTISMAAGKVNHSFRVKNSGADAAVINKIYTSCMCTSASLIVGDLKLGPFGMAGHAFIPKINRALAPGEEASLEVVFDPAAHGPAGVGTIQRVVYLETSAGRQTLEITANVTP